MHHFTWDSQHRLSQYSHTLSWSDGHDTTRAEYLYDALGRRIGKRTVVLNSQGHPREEPRMTWYGWEGDNLVLTERDGQRIHTVYLPGSFVPLLRIEGDIPEPVQTLADTLTQDSGITFTPEVTQQLHQLEQELRDGELSPHSQQWLAVSQLTPERLLPLLKPLPEPTTPVVHLYHCDHLGTPIALINAQGGTDWRAEFDPWGNQVDGSLPKQMYQPLRMQGQHYDEESGMHYNRYRYYDPSLGRYISQDPIGLAGGMNLYAYAGNKPTGYIDPQGLAVCEVLFPDYPIEYSEGKTSTMLGGHGGVLGYDGKGVTGYYEYGRYAPTVNGVIGVKLPTDDGNIRKLSMPNLIMGSDGNPTEASWNKLKESLSKTAGHNTPVELTCNVTADSKVAYDYVENIAKDKDREKYRWNPFSPNQCRTFAENAFEAATK